MTRRSMLNRIRGLHEDTAGHAAGLFDIVPVTGAVLLGAGAAAGEDVLTIVGAVVLAVGLIAGGVVKHSQLDYPVYDRLNALEGDDDASGD